MIRDLSPLSLSVFVSRRHTLPASQWEAAAGKNPEWYRETLGDGSPVIIYLHGNTGTRWDESNRIEALELMLMESSDDQRLLFIHMHNAHKGLWVRVNESESHLFVCIHSYFCHFCRAMSHRVRLMKVNITDLRILIFYFKKPFNSFLFCVFQILSAAGYHVLSLDYRGEKLLAAQSKLLTVHSRSSHFNLKIESQTLIVWGRQ